MEEDLFLLLEVTARDLDHLPQKAAPIIQTRSAFKPPKQVRNLSMLQPHLRERSISCAEVRFECGKKQFFFKRRMVLQCKGKCSDLILQNRNRIERRQGPLDISKKQVKYAMFTE